MFAASSVCYLQTLKFIASKQQQLGIGRSLLIKMANNSSVSGRQWVSHYTGSETLVEDICEQFSKYKGGKVELHKDSVTGIATLKLNHPERRNALSGNF
jgi:hypothetical protein